MNDMEELLHYVWQQKLLPTHPLTTQDGEIIEIINPGLHNTNAGPDFFNAKIKIGGMLWVGNVELHDRASDWHRHHHDNDPNYDNVVLHVCRVIDADITTPSGRRLPQMQLDIPERVLKNHQELLNEVRYPPCFRVIPQMPMLSVHSWLNVLTIERLEAKNQRIFDLLNRHNGDWEHTAFITLARNFGFGVNTDAFELWAEDLPLQAAGKHRDDLFQIEALFFGQAGMLEDNALDPSRHDDYFKRLAAEYAFLKQKFSLTPIAFKNWRFLRLRPQNFPYIRLAQLARLYHSRQADFACLLEAQDIKAIRALLSHGVSDYWQEHYTFGKSAPKQPKTLQNSSVDIILINTIVPLLFAYGKYRQDNALCERAVDFLEKAKAEHNAITRVWDEVGIKAQNAADSQALIQLKHRYCDRKDCLRCRFGVAYLRKSTPPTQD